MYQLVVDDGSKVLCSIPRLYETNGVTSEIQAVADYALEQIGDCTGDQEHIFLCLRVRSHNFYMLIN